MNINARRIQDEHGNEGVFLTRAEYEHVLDEIEELEDMVAYDEARASGEVAIPFEQALAEIEAAERDSQGPTMRKSIDGMTHTSGQTGHSARRNDDDLLERGRGNR